MSAEAITRALGGRWHGSYGTACCPAHEDRNPSLSLRDGDRSILVTCHAGCAREDVLAALRALDLWTAPVAPFRPNPAKAALRKAAEKADRERRIRSARRIWSGYSAPIAGTLAERYLRARAIRCPLPPSLRFNPECLHKDSGQRLPAMIAAVQLAGELVAVHRTFLTEPGRKADVDPVRQFIGPVRGAAVRLSAGTGPLVAAEGIETALSLVDGLSDLAPRVWSALSAAGLAALELPEQPRDLVIAPDPDRVGRNAANALAARAVVLGWRVRIMQPPAAGDWNDAARAEAAALDLHAEEALRRMGPARTSAILDRIAAEEVRS